MALTENAPATGRAWRNGLLVLAGLGAIGALLRLVDAGGIAPLQNFLLVFGSLLIEALPFVLLGATVSAAIEVFVPGSVFTRVARLPARIQMPLAGLGGFAFPVCECGSVPVARRLAVKGMSPAAAVTFMLAAPIINPVVLVSTAVAYRGRSIVWVMVIGRAVLALAAALAVGWVIGRRSREELLRPGRDGPGTQQGHDAHRARGRAFFGHLAGDFVMLARYLIIGAAAAGLLQTLVPQSIISSVAGTPVLNVVALMALASLLSLCSESDAFVAASFVQFGPAAQLGFLVFGAMVDAKLAVLYAGTFTRGFVRTVVIGAAAVTLAGAVWVEVLIG